MDNYRIDSHKLIYHVDRVNDWMQGKNIYPVYMEISPTRACNHRCLFCGLDFMKYEPRSLETTELKERLTELGRLGLRSIMYAGEGEPFLHKDMAALVNHTKQAGIDVAITSNGVLLKKDKAEEILGQTEWIKISINAGQADTYAKIHRTRPDDFDRVIQNMADAAKVRQKHNYSCTLGMQIILLPENYDQVKPLARMARDIGMDYLVVKPYSHHPLSRTERYKDIKYTDYAYVADELAEYNTDQFQVIFRIDTMTQWDRACRGYENCCALPFWSYIDSDGSVWGCSVFIGDERFLYGNIYENSFQEIWTSQRRMKSLSWVKNEYDCSDCRINCRMDKINQYLWNLKNTVPHVNFI